MANLTPEQLDLEAKRAEARGDDLGAAAIRKHMAQALQQEARVQGRGMERSLLQGLTLGFGEEIESKITGQPVGEIRQEMEQYRQRAPLAAGALELGGALPLGFGIGSAATRLPGAARAAGKWLAAPRAAPGAALGAAEGAVYGAGTAPEGRRLEGATKGAGIGALTGGIVTPAVGALTSRLRTGMETERLLEKDIGAGLPHRGAPRSFDYRDIERRAAEFPELTLAEIAGPAGERRADVIATTGIGRQVASETLLPRQADMTRRLISALETSAGDDRPFLRTMRGFERQAQEEATPLYEAARSMPFEPDRELVTMLQSGIDTGDLRKGWELARKDARLRHDQVLPTWRELTGEDGDLTQITLEQIDWMKRGLDARYRELARRTPTYATALLQYKNRLLEKVDDMVPEYQQARRAYADPMQQKDALEAGKDIFKEDAEFTEEFIRGLSQPEKQSYIVGAVQAIRNRLKNVAPEGGMPRTTELAMERMRNAFPDDESFQRFMDVFMNERGMQRFKNKILDQTKTAGLIAAQEETGRAFGVLGPLLQGEYLSAARNLLPLGRKPPSIPAYLEEPMARAYYATGAAIPPVLRRLERPPVPPRLVGPVTTTQATVLMNQLLNQSKGQ